MSRNNHARTKEKRKKLKLKSFYKKVVEKRLRKSLQKPKGITIVGELSKFASYIPYTGTGNYLRRLRKPPVGQRKRRKLAAQTGRY